MSYLSIRMEGSILTSDTLERLERDDLPGQSANDFGISNQSPKELIASAWADSRALWSTFNRRRNDYSENVTGTTETRNLWLLPMLSLLGWKPDSARAEELHGKSYAISHRLKDHDALPVHLVSFRDSLDKRRESGGPRLSPHALVQEYLNLTEHLYGIVTNGLRLRLLRNSTRLIRLSYVEFDLEQMFEEERFADFALMFRLLHITRLPQSQESGPESWLEKYHQLALESGSAIRQGLSRAVEKAILSFANGFLKHPENTDLRKKVLAEELAAQDFNLYLLRLIYRLLFLLVIEERDLVFAPDHDRKLRQIYNEGYSLSRLRRLAERRRFAEERHHDAWDALRSTFRLYEESDIASPLGLQALAGDLFNPRSLGLLSQCRLDNRTLLESLRRLCLFTDRDSKQLRRVNYAALNVEEFGSVYEGLLEYESTWEVQSGRPEFRYVKGSDRSSSGSHYTPDELVQPLLQHGLDPLIERCLKEAKNHPNPQEETERKLLALKVCDPACGSGHILLNAARRIGTELARVRTKEDQPAPSAIRQGVRDAIRHCIYGVDLNPLAVELCKVALWLEAHIPGQPLSFLDHRIKIGNAVVGLAREEELERGIPQEAFKTLEGDHKEIAKQLREQNKGERSVRGQLTLDFSNAFAEDWAEIKQDFKELDELEEANPTEVEGKRKAYRRITQSGRLNRLRQIAHLQVAPFFLRKTPENHSSIPTDALFQAAFKDHRQLTGIAVSRCSTEAYQRRFFHWFLEFPKVFAQGGFDCILGNPPFLGGQKLSGTYGYDFVQWIYWEFAPAGSMDLCGHFFRRAYDLIRPTGFMGMIATNTIAQGGTREGGLEVMCNQGANINHALVSVPWPGVAAVVVSLVNVHKGEWRDKFLLNRRSVKRITSYLDDAKDLGNPFPLISNMEQSFQGSIVLGKGFVLEPEQAETLIAKDPRNAEVLFPYLNGEDLNSRPDQSPSRWVINFQDWPLEKAQEYPDCYRIVEELVKPERDKLKGNATADDRRRRWWQFARQTLKLYRTIKPFKKVLVVARVSKTVAIAYCSSQEIFSEQIIIVVPKTAFFAALQSSFHFYWAWMYSSRLKNDLRYSPTDCFENFLFPTENLNQLDAVGEHYHAKRQQWMMRFNLGLTKTYNAFHAKDIVENTTPDKSTQAPREVKALTKHLENHGLLKKWDEALEGIEELRRLHAEMDEAVLVAYGWHEDSTMGPALELRHDFYEVDFLPENDRVRYTIHPDARREILERLLKLNHQRHEDEVKAGLATPEGKPTEKGKQFLASRHPQAKTEEFTLHNPPAQGSLL